VGDRRVATRRTAVIVFALLLPYAAWQAWQVSASSYPATYDYDEGVYATTAAAAAGGARLYRNIFLSQSPLLIDVLARADRLFGASLAVARATVVAFSLVWLLALYVIAAAADVPVAGIAAVCAMLGSTQFLVQAHTVQMEAPSEALAAAAVALGALGARRSGLWWWVAAGTIAGLAAMTKLSAAACAAPLLGIAWSSLPSVDRPGPPSLQARGADFRAVGSRRDAGSIRLLRLAALATGAGLAAALFLRQIGSRDALAQMVAFHTTLAHRWGFHVEAHMQYLLRLVARMWPLAAAAGAGLVGLRRGLRRGRLVGVLAAWLAADGLIVATITPLWWHHATMLLSPLALLAGVAVERLVRRDRLALRIAAHRRTTADASGAQRAAMRSVGVGLAFAVASAYVLHGAITVGSPASSPALRRMVAQLERTVPAGALVLTDDPMVPFLAHRPVPPWFADTSFARFVSGELTEAALLHALSGDGKAEPSRDGLAGHSRGRRAERSCVRIGAVLFWRGAFRQEVPGLKAEVKILFPARVEGGAGRVLYVARRTAAQPKIRCPSTRQPAGSAARAGDR
jgi:hypothetical protein